MENNNGLEGRDCVPFFNKDRNQIIFEFCYLVFLFVAACVTIFILQIKSHELGINHNNKLALFALLGGFLGGWVYDAKWFYRVTARGKHDQYGFSWQPHKFYWRVMTPFLSALVAFSTYMLLDSGLLPVELKNKDSAKVAISICFVLGYFSDLVLSRLAKWAEKIVPKVTNE
ncbi:hypothetical protein Q9247_06325 [Halomonas meridiana]|uniref:Uncharacterized protein n=1 Tax=Vreelandella aquamarina TaxID=77097 RepID=A0A857GJQ8_9GAMM|nr:hypothetical protein [Halomonas meridiana]MDP4557291.1 hypothetical protein [Halomonas meridiana]QHD48824.1 hypothetical protein CTT34_03535 [Halomonas meridiana]